GKHIEKIVTEEIDVADDAQAAGTTDDEVRAVSKRDGSRRSEASAVVGFENSGVGDVSGVKEDSLARDVRANLAKVEKRLTGVTDNGTRIAAGGRRRCRCSTVNR